MSIKIFILMYQSIAKILFGWVLMSPLTVSARRYYPRDSGDPILDAYSVKIELLIICGYIILLLFALIADGIIQIKKKINKKRSTSYNLDKGEYLFVCYVDSKSFRESGEQPKSTYKSIGKVTQDYIYIKNGTYFYDWCGKFLPVEENPFFGDTTIGEWGKYKYRYKVIYKNTKYCPQGWCYHYFNLPVKINA
jgi:hypothetical protein